MLSCENSREGGVPFGPTFLLKNKNIWLILNKERWETIGGNSVNVMNKTKYFIWLTDFFFKWPRLIYSMSFNVDIVSDFLCSNDSKNVCFWQTDGKPQWSHRLDPAPVNEIHTREMAWFIFIYSKYPNLTFTYNDSLCMLFQMPQDFNIIRLTHGMNHITDNLFHGNSFVVNRPKYHRSAWSV